MRGQHQSLYFNERRHCATMKLEASHADFSSTLEFLATDRLTMVPTSNTVSYRQSASTTVSTPSECDQRLHHFGTDAVFGCIGKWCTVRTLLACNQTRLLQDQWTELPPQLSSALPRATWNESLHLLETTPSVQRNLRT